MEKILCVFEGVRPEKQYFKSLKGVFFPESTVFILATYENDIYELYKELEEDEDLDIIEIIKEFKGSGNDISLSQITRDQIGQVYLFFDYECHDDNFAPSKLLRMLKLFCDETDKGKLFVSYPMVEAIRDIDDEESYLKQTVSVEDCSDYKRISAERGSDIYTQASKLKREHWEFLMFANVRKANHMIHGQKLETPIEDQSAIASCQINNYLPNQVVSILSGFPLFIVDYFGSVKATLP